MPSPILCAIVYILLWWLFLFTALPLGAKPEIDPDPVSGWRGGFSRPRLGRVIVINTIVTTIAWGIAMFIIAHPSWLSFQTGWLSGAE